MQSDTIGLAEAIEILKDPSNLTDPRLMEFVNRVDQMATEILSDKCDTENDEYMLGAISFLQGAVLTIMFDQDYIDIMELLSLMNSQKFAYMMTLAFKMSVGLAAMEELR